MNHPSHTLQRHFLNLEPAGFTSSFTAKTASPNNQVVLTSRKDTPTKQHCNSRTRYNSSKRCPCKAAGSECSKTCHPGCPCTNESTTPQQSKQLTIVIMTTLAKANKEASKNLKEWITCCGVRSPMNDKNILTTQVARLDDQLNNAAQAMLKQQHPQMNE